MAKSMTPERKEYLLDQAKGLFDETIKPAFFEDYEVKTKLEHDTVRDALIKHLKGMVFKKEDYVGDDEDES